MLADIVGGYLDDEASSPVTADTQFDLASLTKLFTALAFLGLVEQLVVELDGDVREVLPVPGGALSGGRPMTWRQLLAHTAGLPATAPMHLAADEAAARAMLVATEPVGRSGEGVVYSDIGFMLLGLAIERLAGRTLDDVITDRVSGPARMTRTTFRPDAATASTEFCAWRRRRLTGEVHDENAAALGGVAGHAGLFGTARDLARLGRILLSGGSPVVEPRTLEEMTREQAVDGPWRRGLGFGLWSPDPAAASHPFGRRTYGHTGFTGTSLWIDPDRRLVVALLTNAVHRGRADRGLAAARRGLHAALVADVDAGERIT